MTTISAAVREQVRQRANRRCEYCRLPEDFGFYSHQVDHIIALKHRGSSSPDNLAYACFNCNNAKGSDIASYDESTNQLTPLYNPRQQAWSDHFELNEAAIVGKTAVGRVTIFLLQMNDDEQVETRQAVIDAGLW